MATLRNKMIITWSAEDNCYLVHLPNFPEQQYRTHGDTYEEAARNRERSVRAAARRRWSTPSTTAGCTNRLIGMARYDLHN
jgi:hypothetical protein